MLLRICTAVLVSLVLAPAAQAGTVQIDSDCDRYSCLWAANYYAGAGERNSVTVTRSGPGVVEVRDDSALVIAGADCAALDPHAARCARADVQNLDARLFLRDAGIAVRRADTFPGLDPTWARIAVRPESLTDRLLTALDRTLQPTH